jgi:hypothetical protein
MRIPGLEINDKAVVIGLVAAYATGVVIVLSILLTANIWPAVSNAF